MYKRQLKDGLKSLDSNTYSLILLDLMLPDGSGLDLCKKIKSNSSLESIPIIILTAKDDEVDKVVGLSSEQMIMLQSHLA